MGQIRGAEGCFWASCVGWCLGFQPSTVHSPGVSILLVPMCVSMGSRLCCVSLFVCDPCVGITVLQLLTAYGRDMIGGCVLSGVVSFRCVLAKSAGGGGCRGAWVSGTALALLVHVLVLSRCLGCAYFDSLCCSTGHCSTGQGVRCAVTLRPVCCPSVVFLCSWASKPCRLCVMSVTALPVLHLWHAYSWWSCFVGRGGWCGGSVWVVWLCLFA